MIVAGRVSKKMAPVPKADLRPGCRRPKWVISMARAELRAASSTTYADRAGRDTWCRWTSTVPGCPPRPEALIYRNHEAASRQR